MKVWHTGITVSDMTVSAPWYCDVFGLKETFKIERQGGFIGDIVGMKDPHVRIRYLEAENHMIELVEYVSPDYDPRADTPARPGTGHLCFECSIPECDEIMANISDGKMIGSAIVPDGPNAGNQVYYFRDPDGYILELVGKVNP